ncbi:acid phosphatase AphA [Photobacterium sagamiensis]|uniref:acid phosphatase AphA n=1 Tax=Photobacterium sagamiensis TaxID=2910241 RepID=UPI003D0B27D9
MKLTTIAISSLLACAFTSCSAFADPKLPGTETGFSSVQIMRQGEPAQLHWISVDDIAKSLKGKQPITVGFDIDDTVLFSSPGYHRGQQEFSPNSFSYLKSQKFWDKMNCDWEKFSLPKEVGKKLIEMHQKRGDDIYFITGRTSSDCEISTQYLKDTFGIKNMHKVIFAGSSKTEYTKTKYIKANNIKMYYGDSDGDIISARNAGAEGIRIMRTANSSYKPVPQNGIYGEKVVKDSQY